MKLSFLSRFLAFTVAFYAGAVGAVFILEIVKTAAFLPHGFWSWLSAGIKGNVFPIALAELFRSPVMGLLFALLGPRWLERSATIKFAVACGAFSYAIAFFFSILGSMRGSFAPLVTNHYLIECSLLGLPVGLVLLSPFLPGGWSGSNEKPGTT